VDVAYKAFCSRLGHAGFVRLMRAMLTRLLDRLRLETLSPEGERAVARFRDIVIHDGSSLALEGHATHSGFADDCLLLADRGDPTGLALVEPAQVITK